MLARMLQGVKPSFWVRWIALIFILTGGPSLAEDPPRDERKNWAPSVGISSGAIVQRLQGAISSSEVYCPVTVPNPGPGDFPVGICTAGQRSTERPFPWLGPDQPVQPGAPSVTRERVFTPYLAATFELMTPRLWERWGAPRPFAHVDLQYTFGFERDVVVLGQPGPLKFPDNFPNPPATIIQGQGSLATVNAASFQFAGGIGVAFTFKISDRTVRIKPSVEYQREDVTYSGEVKRVVQTQSTNSNPPSNPANYRDILLYASKQKVYHSVGPGLEVEVDTRRAGPLMLSLFIGAQAYAVIGDLEVTLKSTNEDPVIVEAGGDEFATWSFLPNRWLFRGNVGLRFRWSPE